MYGWASFQSSHTQMNCGVANPGRGPPGVQPALGGKPRLVHVSKEPPDRRPQRGPRARLPKCRILFATVIMQWPGPRRLSRNRRRNSFVLGPILPSGIGFCPGFWQRSVSDTRLHNSRREKYAALGNLARGRVAGGSFGPERVSAPVRRRLKALPRGDPGQDWLPHRLCRQFTLGKVSCVELKHAPPEVTYTPAQPATLAEGA
jgi:hypothetical protein